MTSGDSRGVTVLTLLKKQIIAQTVLQFWLYSAWIKIKADGPAAQLELMRWWSLKELVMMMEGRVMCVSPWGGSDWGWFKNVGMDLNVQKWECSANWDGNLAGHWGSHFWYVWNEAFRGPASNAGTLQRQTFMSAFAQWHVEEKDNFHIIFTGTVIQF